MSPDSGPRHADTPRATGRDRRLDDGRVLLYPNSPCSPAWGLSPATAIRGAATPNRGSSRAVRSIVRSSDDLRQRARDIRQGNMDGRQHDAQRGRIEHHRDMGRAGQVREQIGVAGPRQAGKTKRFLVDRRRGDPVHSSRHGIVHRADD